jgi:hypothetical protein
MIAPTREAALFGKKAKRNDHEEKSLALVIARSEWWDRLPACLLGDDGQDARPTGNPLVLTGGDCFAALAMTMRQKSFPPETSFQKILYGCGEFENGCTASLHLDPCSGDCQSPILLARKTSNLR